MVLDTVPKEGYAWEMSSDMRIAVMRAKKKPPTRLGAKKVKQFERLESTGETLCSSEATSFRALSARVNYLALDRPALAFPAK